MGAAIAQRLAERGFDVAGWDRDAAARERFAAAGGRVVDDARAVAAHGSAVLTSVTEDGGAREVFASFLAGDVGGRLFLEMSTLRPATARELAPACAARGAAFVDAPLLGTIPNARAGTLFALVGGAADDVARAEAVLAALTRRVAHLGPTGSGYAMKLAANLGLAAYIEALGESLALGEREGLELGAMLDVLTDGITATPWLAHRRPIVDGRADDVTLDVRTLRKDVVSALAAGSAHGATMPLAAGTLAALSAAVAAGYGDGDIGTLTRFVRAAFAQRYD